MTKQGVLHMPYSLPTAVVSRHRREGHNPEPITSGFPPEALARLRAACGVATPAPAEPKEAGEKKKAAPPAWRPVARAPKPADFPFKTLHDYECKNNREVAVVFFEHFASWYEWWRANRQHLTKSQMIEKVGTHRSVWYRHEAEYLAGDEQYATAVDAPPPTWSDIPPLDAPTLHDFSGDNREKGAFICANFAAWLAYKEAHGLKVPTIADMVGVAHSVWYKHQADIKSYPERYRIIKNDKK